MATAGKIPFFGFKAAIRHLIWLGFGASAVVTIADAYMAADEFFVVSDVGRFFTVPAHGRWFVVPAIGRTVTVDE